jgi:hypothetical protein
MGKTNNLFKYIDEEIKIKAKKAGLSGHPGDIGTSREEILINFLKELMPTFFNYGHGKIIDSHENESKQQDIIIFSPLGSIFSKESKMYPVEEVLSTIEVKSNLNVAKLKEALESVKSAKEIDKSISCNIFAYTGDSKETIRKNLIKLKKELLINQDEIFDNLCINGEFLITRDKNLIKLAKKETDFDLVYLELKEKSLPYFLDAIVSEIKLGNVVPLFAKYLGKFKFNMEEWNIK